MKKILFKGEKIGYFEKDSLILIKGYRFRPVYRCSICGADNIKVPNSHCRCAESAYKLRLYKDDVLVEENYAVHDSDLVPMTEDEIEFKKFEELTKIVSHELEIDPKNTEEIRVAVKDGMAEVTITEK
ncbi:MAG: hypothetical protein V1770_04460 [bacterium]